MNASFEQTVLAYLDGLLDRRAEREFLREVSRDPEKQAVLEQYRKLNSTLQNRTEPIAVPLKTQQALAERIPALQDVIPKMAPTVAAGGGSGAAAFFSRKILTLLVGGGLVIGTLTTVLLTDPFSAEDATADLGGQTAVSQNLAPQSPDAADGASATSEAINGRDAAKQSAISPASAASHASSTNAAPASSADLRDTQPARHTSVRDTESRFPEAIARKTGTNRAIAATGDAGRLPASATAALPLREIPLSQHNPDHGRGFAGRPPSLAFRDILDGRLYAYIESGAAQQQMRGSSNLSRDVFRGVYLAGLHYAFSSHFAGGIEVGQSTFAREALVSTREQLTQANGSEIIIIDRSLQDELQPWMRLHALYTFNPDDRLQFQADGGSGLLLGDSPAFIYSLGLSTVYPLTYGLHARAGVHYSGTWLSGSDAQPEIVPSSNGVIGIIRRANNAGTVYASSFEFRIGFGILLW